MRTHHEKLSGLLRACGAAFGAAAILFGAASAIAQDQIAESHSSSKTALAVVQDGHEYELEWEDGELTSATMDGKEIPKDRVECEDGKVRILDEHGEVLFEHEGDFGQHAAGGGVHAWTGTMPAEGTHGYSWSQGGEGSAPRAFVIGGNGDGDTRWRGLAQAGGGDPFVIEAEPPKVMIGVQMANVAGVLAGHLGIDAGKATMLSAVYGGLAAAKAGLNPYDIIVGIDGSDDASPSQIRKTLREKKAGDTVNLDVIQKGIAKSVSITVDSYDAEALEKAEVSTIGTFNDFGFDWGFGQGQAPEAAALAPVAPGAISDEIRRKIEEHMKDFQPFVGVTPGDGQEYQVFVAPDRAKRRFGAAGGDAGSAPSNLERIEDRLARLERLLERLEGGRIERSDEPPPPPPPPSPAGGGGGNS